MAWLLVTIWVCGLVHAAPWLNIALQGTLDKLLGDKRRCGSPGRWHQLPLDNISYPQRLISHPKVLPYTPWIPYQQLRTSNYSQVTPKFHHHSSGTTKIASPQPKDLQNQSGAWPCLHTTHVQATLVHKNVYAGCTMNITNAKCKGVVCAHHHVHCMNMIHTHYTCVCCHMGKRDVRTRVSQTY